MTTSISCDEKDVLVSCLYDEASPAERARFEAHLDACPSCRAELDALTRVRADLTFWQAPEPAVPVRLVSDTPAPGAWAWIRTPAFGLAAAATLVLGLAAGMARVEIRQDATGWSFRTGWGARPSPEVVSAGATPDAVSVQPRPAATLANQVTTASSPDTTAARAPLDPPLPGDAPWRAELAAFESRLRDELALRDAAFTRSRAVSTAAPDMVAFTPEMRQQIQSMIDASEVRQQQNLALRVAEVTRDFDLARRSDFLRIQQGLGRVEGRSEADAARTRDLMNYIMRVSQQGPGQ